MKAVFVIPVLAIFLFLGCSSDDATVGNVHIRVFNSGAVPITRVEINNNSYLNIPVNTFTAYQILEGEGNFPPNHFVIETSEGSITYVVDHIRGATIPNGFYTFETVFSIEGEPLIGNLRED